MKVSLGEFACAGIRAQMGGDFTAGVETAVLHYTGKIKAGRPPIEMPRFNSGSEKRAPELVLDVRFAPEVEELLKQEASRQEGSVEELVEHAVLVYLAQLDFLGAPPSI
jgi:hypothetical protein